jgi:hypothetical protein
MRSPANHFGARIRLRNEPQESRTSQRGICTKQRRHGKKLHKRHSGGGSEPLLARRRHRPGAVLGCAHPVADVASGEGRIVGRPDDQSAVYRDPQGEVDAISARCTNLGCIGSRNPPETS